VPAAGIEDLKEKREEVNRQILQDEEEKQKIQNDLRILTERLSRINDSLARKVASRNEYDKTIMETEAAYMKILESSQVAACACAWFIYTCDGIRVHTTRHSARVCSTRHQSMIKVCH